jgi:ribose 5-phosphate isomerase A
MQQRLKLVDEGKIPEVDVVFDGADEVDAKLDTIKGGGGALLREKIVHSAAKHIVIAAESKKLCTNVRLASTNRNTSFCYSYRQEKAQGGWRWAGNEDAKGRFYPYVTEDGNFVLDTSFTFPSDIRRLEVDLKSIAGVIEVGLFTRCVGV